MENNKPTRGDGLLESFLVKQRIKMANKLLPDSHINDKILDIGCGNFPAFLVQSKFNQKYGLENQIINKQEYLKNNITPILCDIEKITTLPFEDNYFDVVTMLAVVEHIELNRFNFILKEIRRVLKPGGKYILTTPASQRANVALNIMVILKLVSAEEIHEHSVYYTVKLLKKILLKAGFKKQKIKLGYFEFFMNIYLSAQK